MTESIEIMSWEITTQKTHSIIILTATKDIDLTDQGHAKVDARKEWWERHAQLWPCDELKAKGQDYVKVK